MCFPSEGGVHAGDRLRQIIQQDRAAGWPPVDFLEEEAK